MDTNSINELRSIMFQQMRDLSNADKKIDLERAKAVAEAAQVIINSAKVEIDYLRATNQTRGTGFIPLEPAPEKPAPSNGPTVQKTGAGTATVTPVPGGRILAHKAS